MVNIEMGVREKALRNLAILCLIPFVITNWIFTWIFFYFFQQQIWPAFGMEEGFIIWSLVIINFLLISILSLIAVFYVKSSDDSKT